MTMQPRLTGVRPAMRALVVVAWAFCLLLESAAISSERTS